MNPVNVSVIAKQASKMLVLLRSLGLLFTASITRTLSRTVKGQVMLLMIILMIKLTSCETFGISLSMVVFVTLLVLFVKFKSESLAMLERTEFDRGQTKTFE